MHSEALSCTNPIAIITSVCLTLVLLHDQTTAVERFGLVSLVDVNPPCAKHNLVTGSVYHLPDTKLSDDGNFSALAFSTSVLLGSAGAMYSVKSAGVTRSITCAGAANVTSGAGSTHSITGTGVESEPVAALVAASGVTGFVFGLFNAFNSLATSPRNEGRALWAIVMSYKSSSRIQSLQTALGPRVATSAFSHQCCSVREA